MTQSINGCRGAFRGEMVNDTINQRVTARRAGVRTGQVQVQVRRGRIPALWPVPRCRCAGCSAVTHWGERGHTAVCDENHSGFMPRSGLSASGSGRVAGGGRGAYLKLNSGPVSDDATAAGGMLAALWNRSPRHTVSQGRGGPVGELGT